MVQTSIYGHINGSDSEKHGSGPIRPVDPRSKFLITRSEVFSDGVAVLFGKNRNDCAWRRKRQCYRRRRSGGLSMRKTPTCTVVGNQLSCERERFVSNSLEDLEKD